MAFHVVDVAIRVDRLDFTLVITQPAGIATLLAALEPVEHSQFGRQCQSRTQRAHIAAEHFAGEQVDHQQQEGVGHEGPATIKLERDRGLERLHLGKPFGGRHGIQRHSEQHQQNDVLDGP